MEGGRWREVDGGKCRCEEGEEACGEGARVLTCGGIAEAQRRWCSGTEGGGWREVDAGKEDDAR